MEKSAIADFWGERPCGATLAGELEAGTPEFFQTTERARYRREPFIKDFAAFENWYGKKVLEVGCGIGADLSMFARYGAEAYGLDLTHRGAWLSSRRLSCLGLPQRVITADAETLPFQDGSFDLVYSWGVIHHSPDTAAAARELVRVARAGGKVIAMIYNRHSLVALQAYLLYGLLSGRPLRSVRDIIAHHLESPGTKAFTLREARDLFAGLEHLSITPVLTPYDLRIGRNKFLSPWTAALAPRRLGYFLVCQGFKG